jgi:hypothetical protein
MTAAATERTALVHTDGRPLVLGEEERTDGALAATPIAALLHEAVRRGTPVAELKELVALYEHMEAREAQKLFAAALAKFQSQCRPIFKGSTAKITGTGGSYEYTYAELDDIARAANPLLAPLGLSYSWDSKLDKDLLTVICTIRHEAGHSQGSTFTCSIETLNKVSGQQKVGGALTYAKRQSLTSALGITTTEDLDVDGADEQLIGDKDVEELASMVEKACAGKTEEKAERFRTRFLNFMGVEFLAEIKAADLKKAQSALRQSMEASAAAP